jgi:DNA polymerase-3 subunit gamma/tau
LVQADVLAEAAEAILARDAARVLRLADRLASHGQDLRQFALELLGHLRDLAILKVCAEPGPLLEGARVGREVARRQAERASVPELELMIRTLQQAEGEMRRAAQPRFLLEMALLRLTEIRHLQGLGDILSRLVALEGQMAGGSAAATAELPLFGPRPTPMDRPARTAEAANASPAPSPVRPPDAPSSQAAALDIATGWAALVGRLRGRKRLASVLTEVQPAGLEDETLTLEVKNGNAFVRDTLEDAETRRLIADAAAEGYGRRLRVEYRFTAPPPPRLDPVGEVRRPPAAPPRVRDHPLVREALDLFGGTVVREVGT